MITAESGALANISHRGVRYVLSLPTESQSVLQEIELASNKGIITRHSSTSSSRINVCYGLLGV